MMVPSVVAYWHLQHTYQVAWPGKSCTDRGKIPPFSSLLLSHPPYYCYYIALLLSHPPYDCHYHRATLISLHPKYCYYFVIMVIIVNVNVTRCSIISTCWMLTFPQAGMAVFSLENVKLESNRCVMTTAKRT